MHTAHLPQALGLEGVGLSSWGEVARLAWLPSLRRLALSGNPIASLTYPRSAAPPGPTALFELNPPDLTPAPSSSSDGSGGQEQQQGQCPAFAHLQALLLADCGISSWRDVDELGLFPALRELRVSDNPLFQGGQG